MVEENKFFISKTHYTDDKTNIQFVLPSDAMIEGIGFVAIPVDIIRIKLSDKEEYYPVAHLTSEDMLEVSVKNIERTIVRGCTPILSNILGQGLFNYAKLIVEKASPDTPRTVVGFNSIKEDVVGRVLPRPIILKKGDIIECNLTVSKLVTTRRKYIWSLLLYGKFLDYVPDRKRELLYIRTSFVKDLSADIILDLPTPSLLHNFAFVNGENAVIKNVLGSESANVSVPYIFNASGGTYGHEEIFSKTLSILEEHTLSEFILNWKRAGLVVNIIDVSALHDYLFSKYLYPLDKIMRYNDVVTTRLNSYNKGGKAERPIECYWNYYEYSLIEIKNNTTTITSREENK